MRGYRLGGYRFVALALLIPLYKELHFYFIHRLLHYRPLYKFIHSLHHRNTDIEPFCGLTMHPLEHLYFFSHLGLALYVKMSPFHLM